MGRERERFKLQTMYICTFAKPRQKSSSDGNKAGCVHLSSCVFVRFISSLQTLSSWCPLRSARCSALGLIQIAKRDPSVRWMDIQSKVVTKTDAELVHCRLYPTTPSYCKAILHAQAASSTRYILVFGPAHYGTRPRAAGACAA